MGLPAFKTFRSPDYWLMKLQDNVQDVLQAIIGVNIVNGRLATFTAAAAIAPNTDFILNHRLGTPVTGMHPSMSQSFVSLFWISPTKNPAPSSQVILQSNTAIPFGQVLNFWVY